MATWTEPKTDWQATDPLTYQDYNRIKNNLEYLNDIYNELYGEYDIDFGDDMAIDQMYKASSWNKFEDCIEHFQRSGTIHVIGEKSVYEDNGHLPNFNQLNRIEELTLEYSQYDMVHVERVSISTTIDTEGISSGTYIYIYPGDATNQNFTLSSSNNLVEFSNIRHLEESSTDAYALYFADSYPLTHGDITITCICEDGGITDSTNVTVVHNRTVYRYVNYQDLYPIDFIYLGNTYYSDVHGVNSFCTLISQKCMGFCYNSIEDNEEYPGSYRSMELRYDIDNIYDENFSDSLKSIKGYVKVPDSGTWVWEYAAPPFLETFGLSDSDAGPYPYPAPTITYLNNTNGRKCDKLVSSETNDIDGYWCVNSTIPSTSSGTATYGYGITRTGSKQKVAYSAGKSMFLRPMYNVLNTAQVRKEPINGIYYFDYNNFDDNILLSSLPIGSIVRDAPYGQ